MHKRKNDQVCKVISLFPTTLCHGACLSGVILKVRGRCRRGSKSCVCVCVCVLVHVCVLVRGQQLVLQELKDFMDH